MKCYKEIKLVWSERFPDFQPGVIPVAVEFRPNSENLFKFQHPENPVYVFGPEDGSLERDVLTKCHRFVCIDTAECLNLAVAVGTMLYDYRLKEFQNGST